MGLFDDIIVPKAYLKGLLSKKEEKLFRAVSHQVKGGTVRGCEFQTKSLANSLFTYKIYRQKLYVHEINNSGKSRWNPVAHNGDVCFHEYLEADNGDTYSAQFKFRFEKGRIDSKKLIELTLDTTADEKTREGKMWNIEQKILDEYRHSSLRYKFYLGLEKLFQKLTNWARTKHQIPLSIRKEAYKKSGRLKKQPDCLRVYGDT